MIVVRIVLFHQWIKPFSISTKQWILKEIQKPTPKNGQLRNLTSTGIPLHQNSRPNNLILSYKIEVPDKLHFHHPAYVLMHSVYKTYLNAYVLSQSLSASDALLDISQ